MKLVGSGPDAKSQVLIEVTTSDGSKTVSYTVSARYVPNNSVIASILAVGTPVKIGETLVTFSPPRP